MGPRLAIEVVDVARAGGAWRVRWRITAAGEALVLRGVAAPHGKFRAVEHAFDLALPPGASTEIALDVTCPEPPGSEVENAFLILTARSGDRDWRILARLRVRVGDDGTPRPVTERIDAQEVGFSGRG